MSRKATRPFLIDQDAQGAFRLTVRDTQYNSQDYPVVVARLQDETFRSVHEARAYAKTKYSAQPGEFEVKRGDA